MGLRVAGGGCFFSRWGNECMVDWKASSNMGLLDDWGVEGCVAELSAQGTGHAGGSRRRGRVVEVERRMASWSLKGDVAHFSGGGCGWRAGCSRRHWGGTVEARLIQHWHSTGLPPATIDHCKSQLRDIQSDPKYCLSPEWEGLRLWVPAAAMNLSWMGRGPTIRYYHGWMPR